MWCACGQSECDSCHNSGRHYAKAGYPGQREITQPGGRNYLCKCDLAGYEMEICVRVRVAEMLDPHTSSLDLQTLECIDTPLFLFVLVLFPNVQLNCALLLIR